MLDISGLGAAIEGKLTIVPGIYAIEQGKPVMFRAYVDAAGKKTEVTNDAVWSTSDTAIAATQPTRGLVVAGAPGKVAVMATYNKQTAGAELDVKRSTVGIVALVGLFGAGLAAAGVGYWLGRRN